MLKAKKDKIRVAIYTKKFKMYGDIYLYENSRLSDILNAEINRDFIPLTNVKVYTEDEEKLITSQPFLAVNKHDIVLVYPDVESKEAIKTYLDQAKKYLRKNSFDSAILEAKKVLTVDPENAEAYYILGIAYGKKHLLNEALKAFEDAHKFAEPGSDIYHMAGEMINQIKI